MIVHFQNSIAHATGIHWHGIELHNASDGTPLTQNQVPPGRHVSSTSSRSRGQGIYWYHPHHHSSTNQVFKGLYGVDHRDRSERRDARRQRHTALGGGDADAGLERHRCARPDQQPAAGMQTLCITSPMRRRRARPLDEDGAAPYSRRRRAQHPTGTADHSGPVNEGEIVLTNGMNVGRARWHAGEIRARSSRARSRSTSLPDRECGCSSSTQRRPGSSACA